MRNRPMRQSMTMVLLAALLGFAVQPAAAAPAAKKTFKVGKSTFTGTPRTICVIEGEWADSQPFRYDAWDECSKMNVRRASAKQYAGAPSLGENDEYEVSDIPPGSEVLEVDNTYTTVLLFRDRKGVMREIMIGD